MAYVIEMIPKEEHRGYMIPGYKEIVPYSWVIDKEKDIKLFNYWTNIDAPHEEYFALVCKNEVIKVVLIQDTTDENTIRWKLYRGLDASDDVVQELREAIKAYGFSGNPFLKMEIKTVIDF